MLRGAQAKDRTSHGAVQLNRSSSVAQQHSSAPSMDQITEARAAQALRPCSRPPAPRARPQLTPPQPCGVVLEGDVRPAIEVEHAVGVVHPA